MSSTTGKKKQKAEGIRGKKKQKQDESIILESPLSPELLGDASIKKYFSEHNSTLPYKHAVFHNLCNADRMRLIHDEAKNNMTATFKETDLFKVCYVLKVYIA
jgi:hypothetical protein